MQNSTNMRILELLRFLYERTDENHPATVSDIIAHLLFLLAGFFAGFEVVFANLRDPC